MGDLAPFAPWLGGSTFGLLVFIILFLLRSNRADRGQAHQAIKADRDQAQQAIHDAEARADAAEARERRTREEAEARERELQQRIDEERKARRAAEDLHAQVLIEVRALKHKVDRLESELSRWTAGGP